MPTVQDRWDPAGDPSGDRPARLEADFSAHSYGFQPGGFNQPEAVQGRMKLKVNRDKSAVDRPVKRVFLGYSFTLQQRPKIRVRRSQAER